MFPEGELVMAYEVNHSKEELLANISDLFLKYGLRSTSMDDISTYLKISKKTLYQIFENKDDVVGQVMSYRLENLRMQTRAEELTKIGPVRFLYNIKKHIIESLNSRLPANYFDLRKYHPEVNRRVQAERDKIMKSVLRKVLARGIEEGFFKKEADMELQMYMFNRQMGFLEEQEMPVYIEYPLPLLISTIVDNFILCISTARGIAEFEQICKTEYVGNESNRANK